MTNSWVVLQNVGLQFIIHSGNHKLIYKDGKTEVIENALWQGTIVYMEISTSKDIDPNLLKGENCVALDFEGVNVVSNSFADECIAKLLLEMPITELKEHMTFCNPNPIAERSIFVALQRRYKVTAS